MDKGETHQDALKREIQEETGVVVQAKEVIGEYIFEYPKENMVVRVTAQVFVAKVLDGTGMFIKEIHEANSKVSPPMWISLEELNMEEVIGDEVEFITRVQEKIDYYLEKLSLTESRIDGELSGSNLR